MNKKEWQVKIVENEEEYWIFTRSNNRDNYQAGCGPGSIKPKKYPCKVSMLPQQELYDDATTPKNTKFEYFND